MAQALSKTTVLMSGAALALLGAAVVFLAPVRDALYTPPGSAGILTLSGLPDHVRIDGEISRQGKLAVIEGKKTADGSFVIPASPGAPLQSIVLRLHDTDTDDFYDLAFSRTLSLAGFTPQTKLTISSAGKTIEGGLPMDWAGRMTMALPAQRPLTLSWVQGGRTYEATDRKSVV